MAVSTLQTLMGAAAARPANAKGQSLAPHVAPRAQGLITGLRRGVVCTQDRAVLGRAGRAQARDLAAPRWAFALRADGSIFEWH